MKKRGERYLSEYYDKEFHVATKTIALEQSFTVPIGPLKIGGKIDRVDALPSGKIEIIDYKTGRMPSRRGRYEPATVDVCHSGNKYSRGTIWQET